MASNVGATSNPVADMARTLLQRFDKNHDNRLSADEFADFLTNLLSAAGSTKPTTAASKLPSASGQKTVAAIGDMPRSPMGGFDFNKVRDLTHQTVKYKMARVLWNADLSVVRDKASAEALLNSLKADMEAAGLTIKGISGDKVTLLADNGDQITIDVIFATGSASQTFQWLEVPKG